MSKRQEQFTSTLQKAVGKVLSNGLQDPRIAGLVNVTRVKLSKDMRSATVYLSITPEDQVEDTLAGLKSAMGYIRRQMDRYMEARLIPQLAFEHDTTLGQQQALSEAFGEIAKESADLPVGENAWTPEEEATDERN